MEKLRKKNDVNGLVKCLVNRDREIRRKAVKALGEIKDPASIEPLLEILKDDDETVVREVANVLTNYGSELIEPLIGFLHHATLFKEGPYSEKFKGNTKEGFKIIAAPSLVKLLIRALRTERFRFERNEILTILGDIGDSRGVRTIAKVFKETADKRGLAYACMHGNAEAALRALERIGDASVLRSIMEDIWLVNRELAVIVLTSFEEHAVEPLIRTLAKKSSHSREIAAEALGKIGNRQAVEPLIKVLEEDSSRIRRIAADALGNIGDKRAIEPLIGALQNEKKDQFFEARYSAFNALKKLGNPEIAESYMRGFMIKHRKHLDNLERIRKEMREDKY